MDIEKIIKRLKSLGDPEAAKGMARFGIDAGDAYGVSIPNLRKLAKEIGRDHEIALELWARPVRETRILAGMIADPELLTEETAEKWVQDFYDWEICDQTCFNVLDKTEYAYRKCFEWADREDEFVRRAGFALMARLGWTSKTLNNKDIEAFYPVIRKYATDPRNFVKKAVNWALRQIGKRNPALNKSAIALARDIIDIDSSSARWIARDALRELQSEAVQNRLAKK